MPLKRNPVEEKHTKLKNSKKMTKEKVQWRDSIEQKRNTGKDATNCSWTLKRHLEEGVTWVGS